MNNIKIARITRNIKQAELAKILNVSQGTLSNWERGEHDPDIPSLLKMSGVLGASLDYLLNNPNAQTPTDEKKEPAPETGSFDWLRQGLIARGVIKNNEDLTDEHLAIALKNLDALVQLLSQLGKN